MKGKVVFIDTETGGLDASKNSILSFAAVILHNGSISDSMYCLVREPEINAEPSAMAINKLDLEVVATEGLTPAEAVFKLKNFLLRNDIRSKAQFAAHNAPFDIAFTKRMFSLAGESYDKVFSYRPLCTQTGALLLELAGRISLPGGSASLDNLVKFFKVDLDRTAGHNALNDAIAGAKVLVKELELIGGKSA